MNPETDKQEKEGPKANGTLGDLNCWKSQLEESHGMAKAMKVDKHMDMEWEEIGNEAGLLISKLEREIGNYGTGVDVLSMLRGGREKDWNYQEISEVKKVHKDSTSQLKKE
ncbi:hypothetical protein FBULB1_1403 [Fusarium bulbicola]|nr:hypothetical protein FBULB1_1403 [Fusarium bulbicola]